MLMGVEVGDTIHNCIMAFLLNGDNFRRGFGIVAAYDIFNLLKVRNDFTAVPGDGLAGSMVNFLYWGLYWGVVS